MKTCLNKAKSFMDLTLWEYKMIKYTPEVIASNWLYLAHIIINRKALTTVNHNYSVSLKTEPLENGRCLSSCLSKHIKLSHLLIYEFMSSCAYQASTEHVFSEWPISSEKDKKLNWNCIWLTKLKRLLAKDTKEANKFQNCWKYCKWNIIQ